MTQKIILITIGSLGDLNPFIALAHALSEEGYKPIIATSEPYRDYIKSENIEFFPIKPDITDLKEGLGLDLPDLARSMAKNDRFLFEKVLFPYLSDTYDDLLPICEDVVAIISHSISFAARPVGEKLKKISFTILLSPLMIYSPLDPPKGSIIPFMDDPNTKVGIAYNQLLIGLMGFLASVWAHPLRKLRSSRGLPKLKGLNLLLGDKERSHHIALFNSSLISSILALQKATISGVFLGVSIINSFNSSSISTSSTTTSPKSTYFILPASALQGWHHDAENFKSCFIFRGFFLYNCFNCLLTLLIPNLKRFFLSASNKNLIL